MKKSPLNIYNRRPTDSANKSIKDIDIAIYQAIILHVGGIDNLKNIIENITGQKIEIRQ